MSSLTSQELFPFFYSVPHLEPLDLCDYSPRPTGSSPTVHSREYETQPPGYIQALRHSVKNSISFYSIKFHKDFRGEICENQILKWAYIMTKMARLYHMYEPNELKRELSSAAHLSRQHKIIAKINPDAKVGKAVNQDIFLTFNHGFEALYRRHYSLLHPFYDPGFTILSVGSISLSDTDKVEMKMHLKQLGLKKGGFVALLSIPSAGFQRISTPPFCFEMALLLEDLFKEISLCPTNVRSIQNSSDPIALLKTTSIILEMFENLKAFSVGEKDALVKHLAFAFTDWISYVHNIFLDGSYQIPKKIEDQDFSNLIEIFKFRQTDLRVEKKQNHLDQLIALQEIFEKIMNQEQIGEAQILYLGASIPSQNSEFENWIRRKGPLPQSFSTTCLELVDRFLCQKCDWTDEQCSQTLRMFFMAIHDWDRFVYKVLSLPHILEGAFKEKAVPVLC